MARRARPFQYFNISCLNRKEKMPLSNGRVENSKSSSYNVNPRFNGHRDFLTIHQILDLVTKFGTVTNQSSVSNWVVQVPSWPSGLGVGLWNRRPEIDPRTFRCNINVNLYITTHKIMPYTCTPFGSINLSLNSCVSIVDGHFHNLQLFVHPIHTPNIGPIDHGIISI